MFSVLDFGAVPDGKTLAREAFQAAVDACHAAGGGTVLVPAGRYLLGTVILRSNVEVHFEAGATVLGSCDFERDYLPREEFVGGKYQDDSHSFYDHSLFVCKDACNVSFTGYGKIDMQGIFSDTDHGQYYRNIKIFAFRSCRDLVFRDLTLLRAADLALWLVDCEHVRIHGLSLDVLVDGISPDGCRDVVISDCIIKADDDALVLKTSFSLGRFVHSEHIAISNCIISSNASAIKIGTETNGDFRNISITGCVIKNVRRAGIAIESVDGANISGILVSNVTMYNVATPLYIRLGSRLRAPEGTPVGSLRDVMLSNIFADSPSLPYKTPYLYLPGQQFIGPECTPFEFASQIEGIASAPIENLTLRDVTLVTTGGLSPEKALAWPLPENDNGYPDVNKYAWNKPLPASGLILRHVHGFRAENFTLRTHSPDTRPPILSADVTER
jgi:polygalacturonase